MVCLDSVLAGAICPSDSARRLAGSAPTAVRLGRWLISSDTVVC